MTEPAGTGATPTRLPGIDFLRGIAAAAVAIAHVVQIALPDVCDRHRAEWSAPGGWGVGLFFVISGFCIHAPMVRQEMAGRGSALDLRPFYRRRFVRLYPAHVVALALSIAAAALIATPPGFHSLVSVPTPPQLAAHLFMVHTFSASAFYSANGVLWTLAIETHFYLAYPLFLALRRRFGSGRVCAALFAMSALATAVSPRVPLRFALVFENAPFRWWEWVLGCVVVEAVLAQKPRVRPGLAAVIAAALATLCAGIALAHLPGGGRLRTLAWPIAFGGVVLLASWMRDPGRGPVARALLAVGKASYSLYLVHPIAIHLAVAAVVAIEVGAPWPVALVAGAALATALLTWGFYRAVERPFMTRAVAAGATSRRAGAPRP